MNNDFNELLGHNHNSSCCRSNCFIVGPTGPTGATGPTGPSGEDV